MSSTVPRCQAALDCHAKLASLVERRPRGDQWLFEARGAAHQLSFEVEQAAAADLRPVALAVRDLFGHLLRFGLQDGDEILPAIARLLEHIGARLARSAEIEAAAPPPLALALVPQPNVALAADASAATPAPAAAPTTGSASLRIVPPAAPAAPRKPRLDVREAWRMVNESRLGEILVREGRVDGRTLDQALVLQQVGCKRLGEVLVGMGKLSPDDLQRALQQQREMTLKLADGISLGGGLRLAASPEPRSA